MLLGSMLGAALLTLAPSLPAQKAFLERLPSAPIAELRLQNPKAFLAELRRSKVGRVLDDDVLGVLAGDLGKTGVWEQLQRSFTEDVPAELRAMLARLWEVLAASEGELHVAADSALDAGGAPSGWMVLALGAGDEALASLELALGKVLGIEEGAAALGELDFGGARRALRGGPELQFLQPFRADGALWVVLGSDLRKQIAKPRPEAGIQGLLAGRQEPLCAALDLGRVFRMIAQEEADDEEAQAVMKTLGVADLGRLEVAVAIRDGRILQRMELGLPRSGVIRTLCGGLLPEAGGARGLLPRIPDGIGHCTVGRVDPGELWKGALKIAGIALECQGMEGIEPKDMLEMQLGFDLEAELVKRLDGTVLDLEVLEEPEGEDGQGIEGLASMGRVFGLGIREPEALAKLIDGQLAGMGLDQGRTGEKHGGRSLYRVPVMGMFELHYSVTDRHLLVGLGDKAPKAIKAVIDREKQLAKGAEGFEAPKAFREQLAMVPHEPSLLTWLDSSRFVANLLGSMVQGLAGLDMGAEIGEEAGASVAEVVARAGRLLRKHGVGSSMTAAGNDGGKLWMLTVW